MQADSSYSSQSYSPQYPSTVDSFLFKRAQTRRKVLTSLSAEKSFLENIAVGGKVSEVFTVFCRMIERQSSGMLCSILLLDGATLRHIAAPSLPESYVKQLDGMGIGPQGGSCGTAAYQKETIIVSDIAQDTRWEAYRSLALEHHFCASWSMPIFSSMGTVLGTFALYYSQPCSPSVEEQSLVEIYAHFAGLVLERSRVEQALDYTTDRLGRLEGIANLIPWQARYSTRQMTYMAPQIKTLLGFADDHWYQDHLWEEHIHPDDREWVMAHCRNACTQPHDFEIEYRLMTAAGTSVWVHDVVSIIHNQKGEPEYLQGVMVDITKYKEAEVSIVKSEERLQAILDNSPAFVFVKDASGRYLMVNRQWENRFSKSKMEVLGKTVHEVFPPEVADALMANDHQVLEAGAPLEFEEVIPQEDDLRTYLSVKFPVPSFNEESTSICGIATDITDRKRTENLLQAQNTVLQLLVGGEPLNTVLDKLCFLIEQQRPGTFCSILLMEKDGKTLRLESAPSMPAEFARAIDGLNVGEFNGSCGAAAFHGKQVIVPDMSKDPSTLAFAEFSLQHGIRACWSTPFFGPDGKVLGSFGICHSVPCSPSSFDQHLMATAAHLASIACERQRTEHALNESESRLRQSQKMEAIGTLAGGIAHDFNNILTAILGFNELARSFLPSTSPVYRYLEEVHAAGIRAKGLTNQILVFSRQTDQERKPTHLPGVIEEALRFLRATLPTTMEINTHLIAKVSPIVADPVQMHQVLMNLCTNAAQAMGDHSGVLDVSLENCQLSDSDITQMFPGSDLKEGAYLKLMVQDTGPGMPPEVVERVFDPFFTTKGVGEGVGLGLSVVHGIISNHGGAIKVESEVEKGTTFTIFLPQLDSPVISDGLQETVLKIGNGERILFVEDEPSIIHLGQEILKQLGYTVVVKTHSQDALSAFQERPNDYDLVITDQTMPNMTGEVLSQELLRIRPDIPIILCTGYSPNMTPEKAQALGIRAFLWKPLLLHDLSQAIHQVLTS